MPRPELALIHGSPGDAQVWKGVVPALDGRFRPHLPELPGQGAQPPLPGDGPGTVDDRAARIEAQLAGIDGPLAVAGHSFGAYVALVVAMRRRLEVSHLVLFEPAVVPILREIGEHDLASRSEAHFTDYIANHESGNPDAVSAMIDYWFGDGAFRAMPERAKDYLRDNTAADVLDVRAALDYRLPRAELAAVTTPTLVVCGGASPAVNHMLCRAAADLVADGQYDVLDGGTHAMLATHPEQVAAIIAGFALD